MLGFDETKVRASIAFKEVWDINFLPKTSNPRRQASRWKFKNPEKFLD
jgi:hypothetical protein